MELYIRFTVNEMVRACNSGVLEQLAAVTKGKTEELIEAGEPQFPPVQQVAEAVQPASAPVQQAPAPQFAPQQPVYQPAPQAVPVQQAPVTPQPMQPPFQQPAQPPSVPVAPAPQYTIEQLGVAASPLVDAGRGPELSAWLQQHGAQALTQLDKSLYGEFALYLRSLGAKI